VGEIFPGVTGHGHHRGELYLNTEAGGPEDSDHATVPVDDPGWRGKGFQPNPGQLQLCTELVSSPDTHRNHVHCYPGAIR